MAIVLETTKAIRMQYRSYLCRYILVSDETEAQYFIVVIYYTVFDSWSLGLVIETFCNFFEGGLHQSRDCILALSTISQKSTQQRPQTTGGPSCTARRRPFSHAPTACRRHKGRRAQSHRSQSRRSTFRTCRHVCKCSSTGRIADPDARDGPLRAVQPAQHFQAQQGSKGGLRFHQLDSHPARADDRSRRRCCTRVSRVDPGPTGLSQHGDGRGRLYKSPACRPVCRVRDQGQDQYDV